VELAPLGYFSKTHGVKGMLQMKLYAGVKLSKLKALFVEEAGNKVPYFINSVSESTRGLLVSLEDVDSIEKSKKLIGKQVLAEKKFLVKDDPEDSLTGFELIDAVYGSLGEILEINDSGAQVVMTLNFRGKEILLPLVDDLVESIDKKNRKLHYNSPEGLIEMYLTNT